MPTTEFRQTAGSLNEHWIIAWPEIRTALIQWTTRAYEPALYYLAAFCEEAEANNTKAEVLSVFLPVEPIEEIRYARESFLTFLEEHNDRRCGGDTPPFRVAPLRDLLSLRRDHHSIREMQELQHITDLLRK
ncbi:hypothetical protein SCAR479_05311 [Seiridium cardinale]|uniref:Uncharacterized protein n=1 Tax=Seiridium cardinale TaxID=138064 RepID=A0ABR2XWR1_9PEZI